MRCGGRQDGCVVRYRCGVVCVCVCVDVAMVWEQKSVAFSAGGPCAWHFCLRSMSLDPNIVCEHLYFIVCKRERGGRKLLVHFLSMSIMSGGGVGSLGTRIQCRLGSMLDAWPSPRS